MQPFYNNIITKDSTVFWFRRDLRLEDNAGLYYSLKENKAVIPIFIFDTEILNQLDDVRDKRVTFIYESLRLLQQQLVQLGTSLIVFYGNPVNIFENLSAKAVYTNHDFESYAQRRDRSVAQILQQKQIIFKTYKDHVIFEKNEVLKDDGKPYTVFTPYSKKWKELLSDFYLKSYPTKRYFNNFKSLPPQPFPRLQDLGFEKVELDFPERVIKLKIIERYQQDRNFPAVSGTSRLSVHLRFGTISIRKLAQAAVKKNETWLNELIWRDFYAMILFHFPYVEKSAFKPAYNNINWRNDPEEFKRWSEGTTGYPIVDAGMRELNATGFMHNRVRMVTASFLVKHLLIDWRWGEAYFSKKLLDYDLASNNGGWQWAAGSGCDAAPYFRIFNPQLQAEKFDVENRYIQKWVPEWNTDKYPKPIVDHKLARERALKAFQTALIGE